MGFNFFMARETSKRQFTFNHQRFFDLILSTFDGWKAESTLELLSGFEHGTPGLEIQWLNH